MTPTRLTPASPETTVNAGFAPTSARCPRISCDDLGLACPHPRGCHRRHPAWSSGRDPPRVKTPKRQHTREFLISRFDSPGLCSTLSRLIQRRRPRAALRAPRREQPDPIPLRRYLEDRLELFRCSGIRGGVDKEVQRLAIMTSAVTAKGPKTRSSSTGPTSASGQQAPDPVPPGTVDRAHREATY